MGRSLSQMSDLKAQYLFRSSLVSFRYPNPNWYPPNADPCAKNKFFSQHQDQRFSFTYISVFLMQWHQASGIISRNGRVSSKSRCQKHFYLKSTVFHSIFYKKILFYLILVVLKRFNVIELVSSSLCKCILCVITRVQHFRHLHTCLENEYWTFGSIQIGFIILIIQIQNFFP